MRLRVGILDPRLVYGVAGGARFFDAELPFRIFSKLLRSLFCKGVQV